MNGQLVGYARCSTDGQDLTAQKEALTALGVPESRIYVDHGLSGTNRNRPGLDAALAACWEGTTLVVTKLDRLARSLADATNIVSELTERGAKLSIGGTVHDPRDPVGRLLFNVLGMVAEFEADLIRQRTKEGLRVAAAKGRLQGRPPKLTPNRERALVAMRHEVNEDGTRSTPWASWPSCSTSVARPSIGQWSEPKATTVEHPDVTSSESAKRAV